VIEAKRQESHSLPGYALAYRAQRFPKAKQEEQQLDVICGPSGREPVSGQTAPTIDVGFRKGGRYVLPSRNGRTVYGNGILSDK
jgi:hypothetical protein